MAYLDNAQKPSHTITAPTGGVAAGAFVLIQNTLYFCPEAIAAAATGSGTWADKIVRGAPKADAQAWAVGQALYWDNSAGVFTTSLVTGTNVVARVVTAVAATTGIVTGDVELLGVMR